VVIIENVKKQPGYLALDDRVMSEIFFEYTFTETIHLILNAELSSKSISDDAVKWFGIMVGIFFDEGINVKRLTLDNRKKED
jgi:hypothetical protein